MRGLEKNINKILNEERSCLINFSENKIYKNYVINTEYEKKQ